MQSIANIKISLQDVISQLCCDKYCNYFVNVIKLEVLQLDSPLMIKCYLENYYYTYTTVYSKFCRSEII